jgi:hypothetical protein
MVPFSAPVNAKMVDPSFALSHVWRVDVFSDDWTGRWVIHLPQITLLGDSGA